MAYRQQLLRATHRPGMRQRHNSGREETMVMDRQHPIPSDLGWAHQYVRATDYGDILDDDGEEIPLEMYGLDDPSWDVPTIQPEEIYPRLRALVITDDGGARDESDYFLRITFLESIAPGAMFVRTTRGKLYLPDYGICASRSGRHRRDVLVIEEAPDNIRLLHEELTRTGYVYAASQLEDLYRKWFR